MKCCFEGKLGRHTQKNLYIIFKTSCSVILMTVQTEGPNGTLGLENEIIGNCTVFPLCSCCGASCPPWATGAIALGPCFEPSFPLFAVATEEMSHNWTVCPDQSSQVQDKTHFQQAVPTCLLSTGELQHPPSLYSFHPSNPLPSSLRSSPLSPPILCPSPPSLADLGIELAMLGKHCPVGLHP